MVLVVENVCTMVSRSQGRVYVAEVAAPQVDDGLAVDEHRD
jgi:hypothetical protein